MKVACVWFDQQTDVSKFAEACLRFSPQICIKKDHAVFIEIGKCKRLYSEQSFKMRMSLLMRRLELDGRLGIGSHIHDSLVIAKYRASNFLELPVHALLDLCDPLERDPVGRKYVERLIEALSNVGIKSLNAFKQIPAKELSSRFGSAGLLARQRLDNDAIVPWPLWKPAEMIEEILNYPYGDCPVGLEGLSFELKKGLDKIFLRLFSRGLKLLKIRLVIWTEKSSFNRVPQREFTFSFLLPQGTVKGALTIIRERLGRQLERGPLSSLVEKIELTVLETAQGSSGQRNLFHSREDEHNQFNFLVSQMAEIYGKDRVYQAQLKQERIPEQSWTPAASVDNRLLSLEGVIPRRPTNLIRPERVEVTENKIYIRQRAFEISKWSQIVERISSQWLDGEISRTYFQVEVSNGAHLWIYQDSKDKYFLHGYFG